VLTDHSDFSTKSDFHFYRSVGRIGLQVAEALAYAHGQRVLHRDIKPSILLLDTRDRVWVTDSGLAKEEGDALTRTGDVVGTLRYMAPERLNGVSEARSDVYGLGLTLYELLTLRSAPEPPRGTPADRGSSEAWRCPTTTNSPKRFASRVRYPGGVTFVRWHQPATHLPPNGGVMAEASGSSPTRVTSFLGEHTSEAGCTIRPRTSTNSRLDCLPAAAPAAGGARSCEKPETSSSFREKGRAMPFGFFNSWSRRASHSPHGGRRPARPRRLRVECLEDQVTPST
jgi:serine/threonine protein kinase